MKRLVGNKHDRTKCPYCLKEIMASLISIRIHMTSHIPEGYTFSVTEIKSRTNRCKTLFQLSITGPCRCGCGKILNYPNEKGWLPDTIPPFVVSGHNMKPGDRNAGSFPKGNEPWNKDQKFPDMPRNSGMFEEGNVPANYNGGVAISDGYAMVLDPTGAKHASGVRKRIPRARLVAEKVLGRPLAPGEILLHKDGDRLNDSPGNLELTTRTESYRRHRTGIYAKINKEKEG